MNIHLKTTPIAKIEADLLILYSWQDEKLDNISFLGASLKTDIINAANKEKYSGREGENLNLYTKGEIDAYKLTVIGLGKDKEFDLYQLRKTLANSIKLAMKMKVKKVAIIPNDRWLKQFEAKIVGEALTEGLNLGAYKFLKYKSEEEKERQIEVEEVVIWVSPNKISHMENGVGVGKILSKATIYARDLINEPASVTTPTFLAKEAFQIAKSSKGNIKLKIYEKEEAEKMGMGAFLGVSKGSDEPPKFIVLNYKEGRAKGKKVVVVGKGITFDTGGLSLKSSDSMMTMKMDMAGAAAVLGIFEGLKELKLKDIEVIGIIAACENMPSGRALKPGDILQAMNGKTIEVLNTDAEGRLTFADALSYAVKQKPEVIIDLATLTGACMVALGQEIAGLWGNDINLIERIRKYAELSGEKVWPMPLEKEYRKLIKSDIADIKNIQTGKYGGAITASLFLNEFVDNVPWAHLDIAGPAYEEEDTALVPKGGAGFGVRTVLQFLLQY